MATTQEDAFPPLRRLLEPLDESDETTWAQERAIELLRSMDDLHIASGRKERLLLRLGQGKVQVPASYSRPSVPLRAIVIGALLMGICGGAMASVALTKWPGWMARAYGKILFRAPQSVLSPPAVPVRRLGHASMESDPMPVQLAPAAAPDPVPGQPLPRHCASATGRGSPAAAAAGTVLRRRGPPGRSDACAPR